jgi:hypothetical protein
MDWLISSGEVGLGIALFVGLAFLVVALSPPKGTLEARRIVNFPGAWIIVGLPLTFAFGCAIALIAVGTGILR